MTLAERFPHLPKRDINRLRAELQRIDAENRELAFLERLMKQKPRHKGP